MGGKGGRGSCGGKAAALPLVFILYTLKTVPEQLHCLKENSKKKPNHGRKGGMVYYSPYTHTISSSFSLGMKVFSTA